jgi:hypothetical protein
MEALYTLIYIIAYILTWFLLFSVVFKVLDKLLRVAFKFELFNFEIFDTEGDKLRNIIFVSVSLALLVSVFYIFSYIGYQPPSVFGDGNISKGNTSEKINNLREEATRIRNTLNDIENLTLRQIQGELTSTLNFIEKIEKETSDQEKAFVEIYNDYKIVKTEVADMMQFLAALDSLTEPQIEAVKLMITDNAKKESNRSFWIGVIISFPIGVCTSITGTIVMRRRKKKK